MKFVVNSLASQLKAVNEIQSNLIPFRNLQLNSYPTFKLIFSISISLSGKPGQMRPVKQAVGSNRKCFIWFANHLKMVWTKPRGAIET